MFTCIGGGWGSEKEAFFPKNIPPVKSRPEPSNYCPCCGQPLKK